MGLIRKAILLLSLLAGSAAVLSSCGSAGTASTKVGSSTDYSGRVLFQSRTLKGTSCNPESKLGTVKVVHLANGKCRRYLVAPPVPRGIAPFGATPFRVPNSVLGSGGPTVIPLVVSNALSKSFAFTATVSSVQVLLACLSVKQVTITISGYEDMKGMTTVPAMTNAPCNDKGTDIDVLPTVKDHQYTLTVNAYSPVEWAMRVVNQLPSSSNAVPN